MESPLATAPSGQSWEHYISGGFTAPLAAVAGNGVAVINGATNDANPAVSVLDVGTPYVEVSCRVNVATSGINTRNHGIAVCAEANNNTHVRLTYRRLSAAVEITQLLDGVETVLATQFGVELLQDGPLIPMRLSVLQGAFGWIVFIGVVQDGPRLVYEMTDLTARNRFNAATRAGIIAEQGGPEFTAITVKKQSV